MSDVYEKASLVVGTAQCPTAAPFVMENELFWLQAGTDFHVAVTSFYLMLTLSI